MGALRNLAAISTILAVPVVLVTDDDRVSRRRAAHLHVRHRRVQRRAEDRHRAPRGPCAPAKSYAATSIARTKTPSCASRLCRRTSPRRCLTRARRLTWSTCGSASSDGRIQFNVLSYMASGLWSRQVSLRAASPKRRSHRPCSRWAAPRPPGRSAPQASKAPGSSSTRSSSRTTTALNPVTDHLIQIYPETFWASIVFFIGVLIVAEVLLLLISASSTFGATSASPRAAWRQLTARRRSHPSRQDGNLLSPNMPCHCEAIAIARPRQSLTLRRDIGARHVFSNASWDVPFQGQAPSRHRFATLTRTRTDGELVGGDRSAAKYLRKLSQLLPDKRKGRSQ